MGPNFLECDRDQVLLLPPSLREWLPAGHLAWFVIDAVDRLDLMAFYGAYRLDGQGRGGASAGSRSAERASLHSTVSSVSNGSRDHAHTVPGGARLRSRRY